MTELSYEARQPWVSRAMSDAGRAQATRLLRAAVLVGLAYYIGARIGFELTLKPSPVSTLWPPNSILLAAFLLSPTRSWWALLGGAFVAHLTVQLQGGIPIPMVLGWFVSNASEGLIGAAIVRRYVKEPLDFESFRQVGIFVVGAAFIGTFVSSFLDAGFVSLIGWSAAGYWEVWFTRTAANVLASMTLVPVIVTWANGGLAALRSASLRCWVESGLLAAGLVAVGVVVFSWQGSSPNPVPVLLYAPLPFLVWAAIRFGPRGTSACLLLVTALAIWGAVNGHGPFVMESPAENARSIQLFLTVFAIPLLTLAAVMREREHTVAAARDNEERLSLALGAANVGTWEWHLPANRGWWSSKSLEILRLDPVVRDAGFKGFLSIVHPDDRVRFSHAMMAAVQDGCSYECEFRIVHPDSSVRWVLGKGKVLYNPAGKPERMIGVNVDITERKLAEELRRDEAALRKSEARFREMADAMPQIVWAVRPDGRLDYFNRRWYELTGALPGELDNWLPMTHPEDRPVCVEALSQAMRTGQPFQIEHRIRVEATGEYRWHLARARPVHNEAGEIVRWYGTCTEIEQQKATERVLREVQLGLEQRVIERSAELSDAVVALREEIAERVAAERALRSSEERFAKAFRASPDAMSIEGRPNERIIEINDKWETLFGFGRAEAIGHSFLELGILERQDHIRLRLLLAKQGYVREVEVNLHDRKGQVLQAVLTIERVRIQDELCTITLIRDVTERKRAQLQLQEQQRELTHLSRVAALGELSGALAHELNQPLAAILANTRAAQRIMLADPPDLVELHEILDDIAFDDRRAGEVISRLRSLLKKGDLKPRPVTLDDIVGDVLGLLHSDLIERRVSAATQLAPSLPPVLGDRIQLQQVLLNLILNACDAMADREPGDRLLTITTALTPRGLVQLSVSDVGIGISEARLEPIFEPFVSTKENGLGLGLAISRSIIMAHGGRLWAVSNGGRGATFFLELDPTDTEITTPIDTGDEDSRAASPLSPAGIR
ncbi:MAG TPA: MASE1 domain-containing protein [Gemmatimonadales bacterium]|nr:MASE1 domain-containing protein [Gemmatimonadales bacterium]